MVEPVPVLLVTGPVGVGKTIVTAEASRLLSEADIPHAVVDLAVIGGCWPKPADDPWNENVIHRNLACMWANFQRAGADRLLLCRVLEARSVLTGITDAVPGAVITVVRLRAPLDTIRARIRVRESGRDPQWFLGAAEYLTGRLEDARVEDYVVDNTGRTATETAAELLHVAGWLPPSAPPSAPPRRPPSGPPDATPNAKTA